jgi:hypothetical protein
MIVMKKAAKVVIIQKLLNKYKANPEGDIISSDHSSKIVSVSKDHAAK